MQTAMATDHVESRVTETGTLVIFTRVEGLLRRRAAEPCDVSRAALEALLLAHVPLVLVSDSSPEDVQAIQGELGFAQPFICDRGARLHIPAAYFTEAAELHPQPWEVFSFDPPDPAAAIRLLCALFVARGHDKILSVGLGCDCSDGTMLAAVDVPIVVRDPHRDQRPLLQYLPGAYLTTATGAVGWLEAVVGPSL
jgi:hypothetical protein